MVYKILLDTNFLLIPFQFRVDIFSEFDRLFSVYELFVLDKNIEELEKIVSEQRGKHRDAAKLGLSLLKARGFNVLKTVKHLNSNSSLPKISFVDNLIVSFAIEGNFIVATQDKLLKEKLKNSEVKIVTLRQKKYLIMG
jgi:hypothetical protein